MRDLCYQLFVVQLPPGIRLPPLCFRGAFGNNLQAESYRLYPAKHAYLKFGHPAMPVYPLDFCFVAPKRAAQHNHFAAFHNALAHFDHAAIAAP